MVAAAGFGLVDAHPLAVGQVEDLVGQDELAYLRMAERGQRSPHLGQNLNWAAPLVMALMKDSTVAKNLPDLGFCRRPRPASR